jgi:predicted RNase H-like HicB family nuclease
VKRYGVIIEKGETSYGAYVPDLPGCVSVGETVEEVEALIREAIEFHIEGLRDGGWPVPRADQHPEVRGSGRSTRGPLIAITRI